MIRESGSRLFTMDHPPIISLLQGSSGVQGAIVLLAKILWLDFARFQMPGNCICRNG